MLAQSNDNPLLGEPEGASSEYLDDTTLGNRTDLFQVLDIVLDKAEETLVQKIIPLQSSIKRICDTKKLGLFEAEKINFPEIAKVSFKITGVYGRKDLVQRFLVHIGAIKPDMNINLNFGVYLYLGSTMNYVFLWDTENSFSKVTRRNIVCNLFRYIQELSQRIIVLLDEYDLAYMVEYENRNVQEDQYMYFHKVVQANTSSNMELTSGFTYNSLITGVQSLTTGFSPGIVASKTTDAKVEKIMKLIRGDQKDTIQFVKDYVATNAVYLPNNLTETELVIRLVMPSNFELLAMDEQIQLQNKEYNEIALLLPAVVKLKLNEYKFFHDYFPDIQEDMWRANEVQLLKNYPWVRTVLDDAINRATHRLQDIHHLAEIVSYIIANSSDSEKITRAKELAFRQVMSVDEFCDKLQSKKSWWQGWGDKVSRDSRKLINPILQGEIENAFQFFDDPAGYFIKGCKVLQDRKQSIKSEWLTKMQQIWKKEKSTCTGVISKVATKHDIVEFQFIYQVLIPAKEIVSVYSLLLEAREGTEVVSTAKQPVTQVAKDKVASQIWHACSIKPYTLVVERFNDEHVNFHVALKGSIQKKQLSQDAKAQLFDCDISGGYLALLSFNLVTIWQIDTSLSFYRLDQIAIFDFLLRDSEFFEAGTITFMRWLPKQRKILFINSEHQMVIYNLAQNQTIPNSDRKIGQNNIKQILVDNVGLYCLIIHSEDTEGASMLITAIEIATMVEIKTLKLPPCFTLQNSSGSTLFEIAGNLYLACIHDCFVHSVGVKLCYEQTTTTIESETEDYFTIHSDTPKRGCAIDYFAFAYSKFCVIPSMNYKRGKTLIVRSLSLHPMLFMTQDEFEQGNVAGIVENYIENCSDELHKLNKGFDNLKLEYNVSTHLSLPDNDNMPQATLADFLYSVIWLAPLQIVRAENNQLRPLSNGLEMNTSDCSTATQIAAGISFGMYEYILASWRGPVKTITSMGKQSTGKSTMMNQLFGTLFDVSGARCTDGVWMTMRVFDNILYILLDFEGFGSIERQPQEDILLAVFNAAVSTVTFLRIENRIDSDFVNVFTRFSQGVGFVKDAANFFKGKLSIVVKDVDKRAVKDVLSEINNKTKKVFRETEIFSKMFHAEFSTVLSPLFETAENFKVSEQLAELAKQQAHPYNHGIGWKNDVTLLMAKLHILDWTPVGKQRVEMYQKFICTFIAEALQKGCTNGRELTTYTGTPIPDVSLEHENISIPDCDVILLSGNETFLASIFEVSQHRVSDNHRTWFLAYEQFIAAIVTRRCERVKSWAYTNELDGEVLSGIDSTVQPFINEFSTKLRLCGQKCAKCYYQCLCYCEHNGPHDCFGSHHCDNKCSHCPIPDNQNTQTTDFILDCGEPAGHAGKHNCRVVSHLCTEQCMLQKYNGCTIQCAELVDHEGTIHLCNSPQHNCGKPCTVYNCPNVCKATPLNHQHTCGGEQQHRCSERICSEAHLCGDQICHHLHFCGEVQCLEKCSMADCPFRCSATHSHANNLNAIHLCDQEHTCKKCCDMPGVCYVDTQATRQHITDTFVGKREQFEFRFIQQNPMRMKCVLTIPAGLKSHDGKCTHSLSNEPHFCEHRCPMCNYICEKPFGHHDKHRTSHGNMVNTVFISTAEEINMGEHKYMVNESGKAEMCNLYCNSLGRGHLHVIKCDDGCKRQPDEVVHATKPFAIEPATPRDEIVHSLFWHNLHWEDPCSREAKQLFSLCSEICRHPTHSDPNNPSYCTRAVLHKDKHLYKCIHPVLHVIAVIDVSSSMKKTDVTPKHAGLQVTHNHRLGAVLDSLERFACARACKYLEDKISIITFNDEPELIVKQQPFTSERISQLSITPSGGTDFSKALKLLHYEIQNAAALKWETRVIFLTDGEDNFWSKHFGKADVEMREIAALCASFNYCWLYLIQFSKSAVAPDLQKLHGIVGHTQSELKFSNDLSSLYSEMLRIVEVVTQRTDLIIPTTRKGQAPTNNNK